MIAFREMDNDVSIIGRQGVTTMTILVLLGFSFLFDLYP